MKFNRQKIDQEAQELSKAAREARNAANRAWRKKNPGKVREYNRRYWERKAAKSGQMRTEAASEA